jgi:hypothetical protein
MTIKIAVPTTTATTTEIVTQLPTHWLEDFGTAAAAPMASVALPETTDSDRAAPTSTEEKEVTLTDEASVPPYWTYVARVAFSQDDDVDAASNRELFIGPDEYSVKFTASDLVCMSVTTAAALKCFFRSASSDFRVFSNACVNKVAQ